MIYNKDKFIVINPNLKEYAGMRGTLKKKWFNGTIEMYELLVDNYPKNFGEPIGINFRKEDLLDLSWDDEAPMPANRYQDLAVSVSGQWKYQNSLKDRIVYNTMSLACEAGEIGSIVQKAIFQQNRQLNSADIEKLIGEISDQFWFAAALCDVLGLNFEDVMKYNLVKLNKRYPNGFSIEESINRKA